MAISDYICCSRCETKLIYDGDQGNRRWWKERFGSEVNIKCPKCAWVGLTQKEIDQCFEQCVIKNFNEDGTEQNIVSTYQAGQAIEDKLKEKNS